MSLNSLIWPTVMAIVVFGGALTSGYATPGTAEKSYPWCAQGSILHCYYMTREQCEQTVDYHGFCVPNPDMSPSQ
jgi:hypothetical protein